MISTPFFWAFCSLPSYCFCTQRRGMRKPGCSFQLRESRVQALPRPTGTDRSSPTCAPLTPAHISKESHNQAWEKKQWQLCYDRQCWAELVAVIWGWNTLVKLHVKLVSSLSAQMASGGSQFGKYSWPHPETYLNFKNPQQYSGGFYILEDPVQFQKWFRQKNSFITTGTVSVWI